MRVTPSSILGLTSGSYEAYCLDEAVWYLGATIEQELEKASQAGRKKSKADNNAEAARKRVLAKYFGNDSGTKNEGFSDPALLFK